MGDGDEVPVGQELHPAGGETEQKEPQQELIAMGVDVGDVEDGEDADVEERRQPTEAKDGIDAAEPHAEGQRRPDEPQTSIRSRVRHGLPPARTLYPNRIPATSGVLAGPSMIAYARPDGCRIVS
jgi:hypothetical protein